MSQRAFAFLCLIATVSAGAQVLPDPTRPPAGLQAAGPADPVTPETLVLQSVLLGPGRTPAAVISGKLVALGGSVGDARLARITPHSVRLDSAQGTTTLTLVPEGQKTTRAPRTESLK
ncbi:MSHA biogenesis protein MshK [Piscinibacter sp. HJYY11]|uniref:MSHA biogenesis protein MshK n=1 Tax=Piscinibacter sp. HJYY11 TaxID=2801333 RepID=UPI00191EB59F|nr:MSHA biogenesis protein MshK [Piscinibacter sp. HJYY11]MBL0727830.1 MSHA biogenesis protein MshK [Piscinibacter sp. HJYY11]